MDSLFKIQEGKCAYTGKDLYFNLGKHGPRTNASLDRIDSDEGYVVGNVHWIVKEINFWKGALNHDDFLNMCKEITIYTERINNLRNNISWDSIKSINSNPKVS